MKCINMYIWTNNGATAKAVNWRYLRYLNIMEVRRINNPPTKNKQSTDDYKRFFIHKSLNFVEVSKLV